MVVLYTEGLGKDGADVTSGSVLTNEWCITGSVSYFNYIHSIIFFQELQKGSFVLLLNQPHCYFIYGGFIMLLRRYRVILIYQTMRTC
jgi:hypothetical protein